MPHTVGRWLPDIPFHEKSRAFQHDRHFTHCIAVSKQYLVQRVWNCDFLALDLCHVRFQGEKKKTEHSELASPLVPFSAQLVSFPSEANTNVQLPALTQPFLYGR